MQKLFFQNYKKPFLTLIAITIFGFWAIIFTDIDYRISDLFWHTKNGWLFKEGDFWFYFFYKYAKKVFIILLITMGILAFLSFFKKKISFANVSVKRYKFKILFSIFMAVFYIIIVSTIRSNSQIPCPKYSLRYKGGTVNKRPFQAIECNGCKCFPGAHSTVGFSLMFFYFIFNDPKKRKNAIKTGLIIGNIFGLYQVSRGEHYIFDNYFSMLIALWMLFVLVWIDCCINRVYKKIIS